MFPDWSRLYIIDGCAFYYRPTTLEAAERAKEIRGKVDSKPWRPGKMPFPSFPVHPEEPEEHEIKELQ